MTFRITILLFLWSLCFGSPGLAMAQSGQEATVLIYRKASGTFAKFGLSINEEQVIPSVQANTYYVVRLSPGKVLMETKGNIFTEQKQYSLTLEAGKIYYLEAVLEYQVYLTTMHLMRRSEKFVKQATLNMKEKKLD